MNSDRTETLAERLRRYADDAAAGAPALAVDLADRTNWRPAISVALTVVAAVVLTVAALAVAPQLGLAPGESPIASGTPPTSDPTLPAMSGSASPAPSADEEASSPPTPTPAAEPTPVPSIPGELPPPDASVPPPSPAPFGDASIYELYTAALRNGLTCESVPYDMEHGSGQEDGGTLYLLGCEASDGVSLSVVVSYWAVDYVSAVHATAVSAAGGTIDSRIALPLFEDLLSATLDDAAEAAAMSYMLDRYDDPTCGPNAECRLRVQDGEMVWIVGQNGARILDLAVPRQ